MNLFEFYVNGDKFFDVRVQELALTDAKLDLKVNSAGTLTFTLPPTHPKKESFKPLKSTIEIFRDGEWFWEGRVIDKSSTFNNSTTYTVEGALGYLNDSIQPQAEFHDTTVIGYVENLLNVHNSQVLDDRKIYLGAVTVKDNNDSVYRYTNFNHTLQELKEDIIDDLGGYLRLRKRDNKLYLDVLEEYDRTCNQTVEIGRNLIDLAPEFDFTELASVIIPLGARIEEQEDYTELEALDKYVTIEEANDGKNYISRSDLTANYGQIWQVVRFDNIHMPENLLKKASEYLTDGQWGEMVIEARAFDLNYTSEEFQEFRLGDRIRVKSDVHGIDRYFPLTAQTINFNNVSQNTITLGGTGEPVTISGVTNIVTINTSKLDEKIKEPNRLIEQAIHQATELINQGLNGYVRVNGNEILIMDTDDPATAKNVWWWNMGGLGYSSNGYNGPFETAMTMDGTIAGKFIAANSIAAEQLDVNYRSKVEEQITQAEEDANDYTDGKLTSYWTSKEVETHLQTTSNSIIGSVNSTLTNYYTSAQVNAQLSIMEGNITSSVSRTYATKNELGQLETSISSVEAQVTADGIFATINRGLSNSERKEITNTYFSFTYSGITIKNGGLTILNNSNERVLYADTSGNLTLMGDIVHYGGARYKAVEITQHEVKIYAYNQSGNYLGSLAAVVEKNSSSPALALYSDYGDDLYIGSKDRYDGTIHSIITLGSYGGVYGIKSILGTTSGGFDFGNATLNVSNGLISSINGKSAVNGTQIVGVWNFTFDHGVVTSLIHNQNQIVQGPISFIDGSRIDFTQGMASNYFGPSIAGWSGNFPIATNQRCYVSNGIITGVY